jgi:hypothetical protein
LHDADFTENHPGRKVEEVTSKQRTGPGRKKPEIALDLTIWQGVSKGITTNNGRCEVIVPLEPGQRYFHLRKQ